MTEKMREAIGFLIYQVNKENETEIGLFFKDDEQTCFDWVDENVIIGYDFDEDGFAPIAFTDHVYDCHGYADVYKFPPELFTVLHELGHYFSNDDEMIEVDWTMRALISVISAPDTLEEYKRVAQNYFDLPTEWAATEWAIEYVKTHEKICNMFMDKIKEER